MWLNGGGASDSLGSDLQKLETIMPRLATPIELAPEEQAELERLLRCSSTPQSLALRARIILMAGEGAGVVETAGRLGTSLWHACQDHAATGLFDCCAGL